MKTRALFVVAAALFLPFAATACGDDGDKKVDAGDVSEKLQDEAGVDKKTADCLGKALSDAGITVDETNLDDITDLSEEKQEAVTKAMTDCVPDVSIPDVSVPE